VSERGARWLGRLVLALLLAGAAFPLYRAEEASFTPEATLFRAPSH
jgi:hypothetical protein